MLLNQNSELYLKRTSEGLSKAYLKKHFPIYIKIKKIHIGGGFWYIYLAVTRRDVGKSHLNRKVKGSIK